MLILLLLGLGSGLETLLIRSQEADIDWLWVLDLPNSGDLEQRFMLILVLGLELDVLAIDGGSHNRVFREDSLSCLVLSNDALLWSDPDLADGDGFQGELDGCLSFREGGGTSWEEIDDGVPGFVLGAEPWLGIA